MNSCPTPSPHTCLFHSPNLPISVTRNMRAEGTVPSRTTIHPHPFVHWLLNLQLFFRHHTLSNGSETLPSLTKPRPYLASRTPLHPHADAHCASAFPRSAFLRLTASSLCYPSFHGIGTSTSLGLLLGNDVDGIESHYRVADDITPLSNFFELEWIRNDH